MTVKLVRTGGVLLLPLALVLVLGACVSPVPFQVVGSANLTFDGPVGPCDASTSVVVAGRAVAACQPPDGPHAGRTIVYFHSYHCNHGLRGVASQNGSVAPLVADATRLDMGDGTTRTAYSTGFDVADGPISVDAVIIDSSGPLPVCLQS